MSYSEWLRKKGADFYELRAMIMELFNKSPVMYWRPTREDSWRAGEPYGTTPMDNVAWSIPPHWIWAEGSEVIVRMESVLNSPDVAAKREGLAKEREFRRQSAGAQFGGKPLEAPKRTAEMEIQISLREKGVADFVPYLGAIMALDSRAHMIARSTTDERDLEKQVEEKVLEVAGHKVVGRLIPHVVEEFAGKVSALLWFLEIGRAVEEELRGKDESYRYRRAFSKLLRAYARYTPYSPEDLEGRYRGYLEWQKNVLPELEQKLVKEGLMPVPSATIRPGATEEIRRGE